MSGKPLFWKMSSEVGLDGRAKIRVVATAEKREASEFFIELDWQHAGKYFFITTYDNGERREQRKVEERQTEDMDGQIIYRRCSSQRNLIWRSKFQGCVKRYVHVKMTPFSIFDADLKLSAYATVETDTARKTARFKAINHQSHCRENLEQSEWLPERGRVEESVPCFLQPRKHVRCLAMQRSVSLIPGQHSDQDTPNVRFCLRRLSQHREGHCHMLFSLTDTQ